MKRQNTQDERVVAQRRKIYSEAFGILMVMLFASILVQQFLLDAPIEQYASEFICLFATSVYMTVRYIMLGLDLFDETKRIKNIPLVMSIFTGIIATAISGVMNYIRFEEHYKDNTGLFIAGQAIFFISLTIFMFGFLSFIVCMNKKKQARIQKRLEEDEQDE